MDDNAIHEHDTQFSDREARAERYFTHDLDDQRKWYSQKASRYKGSAQLLGAAVIAAGAATSFLQVFGEAAWVSVVTAFLGALVALGEGWRNIARYEETWTAYRTASQCMKRERRLYVNGAGEYRNLPDENEAFLRFVENIEAIVAEEQKIFWKGRGTEPPRDKPVSGGNSQVGRTNDEYIQNPNDAITILEPRGN